MLILCEQEEWKPIDFWNISDGTYAVSSYGRIKSLKYNIIRKSHKDKDGYLNIVLYDNEANRKNFKVHRLVAQAFIPNEKDLPQVNHKNGRKRMNFIWNLEWVSNRTNIIHARDHGLRNKTMKINRDRALELCILIAKSKSTEYILNEFGIHNKTTRKEYIKRISGIRRGKIWKDVYEEAQRIVSNEGSTTIERVG